MTAQILAEQFEFNWQTFVLNLDGMTADEGFSLPSPGGNCINWIAGHIVCLRNSVHNLIGLPPAWEDTLASRYQRGSDPVTSSVGVASLDDLRDLLERSQISVRKALSEISAEDLSGLAGDKSVAIQLAGLSFHESYHVGQLGVLRRLAGRDPAIT